MKRISSLAAKKTAQVVELELDDTAYDVVKSVSENLDEITSVNAKVEDGTFDALSDVIENIDEILLADDNAALAALKANEANVSAVAAASSLSTFTDQYTSGTVEPADPEVGQLWFDENINNMRVYNGTSFILAGSSINGTSSRESYTAAAGQTVFAAIYDPGYVDVYQNGFKLAVADFVANNGTAIELNTPALAGDDIYVVGYGTFELANHYTKTESDVRYEPIDATILKDADIGVNVLSPTGDGSNLTGINAGATGGGTDQVFYLNDQVITTDYTIPTGQNAMTAGSVTIADTKTVTIPSGSTWTIV